MPTIGQSPVLIGDTIIEVDTLAFVTVIPVLFLQLRFEVEAPQLDIRGTMREIPGVPLEPTCMVNSQQDYHSKPTCRKIKSGLDEGS